VALSCSLSSLYANSAMVLRKTIKNKMLQFRARYFARNKIS